MVQVYELGILYRLRTVKFLPELPDWPLHLVEGRLSASHHGDFERWQHAVQQLPQGPFDWHPEDAVRVNAPGSHDVLAGALMGLHPWRKGPFQIGPVHLDTEWRSDWKWQRLAPYLNVTDHRVLDIGCGNGYFGWRLLGAGAREVVGVDPTILFCMQHLALQRLIQHPQHWVLPLGIEDLPRSDRFDTVMSMGVIYHRREPEAHLDHLFALTAPGGQLVLESIVTRDEQGFVPESRYARMRNVWRVPSVIELEDWSRRAGYIDVRTVDISPTTLQEQRSTPWMTFESLREALDQTDPRKTVEGYPAPVRAIVMGHRPD